MVVKTRDFVSFLSCFPAFLINCPRLDNERFVRPEYFIRKPGMQEGKDRTLCRVLASIDFVDDAMRFRIQQVMDRHFIVPEGQWHKAWGFTPR